VDAADLISAARQAQAAPPAPETAPAPEAPAPEAVEKPAERIEVEEEIVTKEHNGARPRWMRIRVNDLESGNSRVSVNIPLRLMKFGMKFGRRFAPELEDFDVDELSELMTDAEEGLLVEVRDEAQGEHVQIYLD
jgi:hypothetical protein